MENNNMAFPQSSFSRLAELEANNWWFRARNRVLMWTLSNKVGEFRDLLEIGCGTGFVLQEIRRSYPAANLHGGELYEEGLAIARERIPTALFGRLDARDMTDRERYDVVGAFDVLEHIKDDEFVLANSVRALRSGGTLLLTVPQHRWLWSNVDEYACHERRYTRTELLRKVERVGLSVEYVTSFVSFLVPLMWISRLHASKGGYNPASELRVPSWINLSLEAIMQLELLALKTGVCFPVGGSLLLVARKP